MKLLFATTNKYKIKSAELVLKKYGIKVVGEPAEITEIQASSPEEVAKDKAKKAFKIIKKPLIVMDSGLFIKPLNGFPGVYTNFVLKTLGEDGLIKLTENISPCKAYVQRMIAYTNGKETKIFFSRGHGEIISEKRGDNGINYDLIFYVPEKEKTLAEMTDENQVKAWGDAWNQLGKWLKKNDKE